MTPYSDLTPTQKDQARRDLFYADALMGFNPAEFEYDVDQSGLITGRRPLLAGGREKRQQVRNQPVVLHSARSETLTGEVRYRLDCALNDLSRAVALRLAQKELVNV